MVLTERKGKYQFSDFIVVDDEVDLGQEFGGDLRELIRLENQRDRKRISDRISDKSWLMTFLTREKYPAHEARLSLKRMGLEESQSDLLEGIAWGLKNKNEDGVRLLGSALLCVGITEKELRDVGITDIILE